MTLVSDDVVVHVGEIEHDVLIIAVDLRNLPDEQSDSHIQL